MWLKGKVIFTDGTMVGIDLGTRLLKVNITKLSKDETKSPSRPGLGLPSSDDDLHEDLLEQAKSADRPARRRQHRINKVPQNSSSFILTARRRVNHVVS